MEHGFWHNCWEKNSIGFHQEQSHSLLTENFPTLIAQFKARNHRQPRVLVPLCGKSLDMLFLAQQADVVGAELSEIACQDFFKENQLTPKVSEQDEFIRYQCENLSLFQGDFLKLSPEQVSGCDFIYDRAALIALPDEIREQYIAQLKRYINSGAELFLITLEYPQAQMDGPPFSVDKHLIRDYFNGYQIKELAVKDITGQYCAQRKFEVSLLVERLYLIKA
jgi:thiopurine S-methyltransferase